MDIQKQVAKKICHDNIDALNDYSYKEYYFMNLKQSLRAVLADAKQQGLTMLPEDLMQLLIERDFNEIHSEDF